MKVDRNLVDIKIITDVRIYQCPVWSQTTDLTEDLYAWFVKFIGKSPDEMPIILKQLLDMFLIIRNLFRYDVIITGNIKTAQITAFFRWIFKRRSAKQIILELMLDEPRNSIRWKIKRWLQMHLFKGVDLIFVSARSEIDTYATRFTIPHTKFRFLPFHTDIVNPVVVNTHDGYVLSAGKTGRDYQVLMDAVEGLDVKVIIVSDDHHAIGLRVPANVQLLVNIPYDEYLELLRNCWFVVVPLRKVVKSTGQVVILEAMGLGKPVIATETTGTTDYIETGVNGILVPLENPTALKAAIMNLMSDVDFYSRLAVAGLDTVKKKHTFDMYVATILDAARELVTCQPSRRSSSE